MQEPDIYCPACAWRPRADSRWTCMLSCGTVWNTFWTRGVCPGCRYAWTRTQCLACREFSPHGDWYHYPERSEERERSKIEAPA